MISDAPNRKPSSHSLSLASSRDQAPLQEVLSDIRQILVDPILLKDDVPELDDADFDGLDLSQIARNRGIPLSSFMKGVDRLEFQALGIQPERLRAGIPLTEFSSEQFSKLYHLLQDDLMIRTTLTSLLVIGEYPRELRVHVSLIAPKSSLLRSLRMSDINLQELKDIPLERLMTLGPENDLAIEMSCSQFFKYAEKGDDGRVLLMESVQVCAPHFQLALSEVKKQRLPTPALEVETWEKILVAYDLKNEGHLLLLVALLRNPRVLHVLIALFDPAKNGGNAPHPHLDDDHIASLIGKFNLFPQAELQAFERLANWIESLDFGRMLALELPLLIVENLRSVFTTALSQKRLGSPLPTIGRSLTEHHDNPAHPSFAVIRWGNRIFERIVFQQIHTFGIDTRLSSALDFDGFVKELEAQPPFLVVLFKADSDINEILKRVLMNERLDRVKILIVEDVPFSNTLQFVAEGQVCIAKFDSADTIRFRKCMRAVLVTLMDMPNRLIPADENNPLDEGLERRLVKNGYLSESQAIVARRLANACEQIRNLPEGLGLVLMGSPVTAHQRSPDLSAELKRRQEAQPEDVQAIIKSMLAATELTRVEVDLLIRSPDATAEDRKTVREEEQEMFNSLIQSIKHHTSSLDEVKSYLENHEVSVEDRNSLLFVSTATENLDLIRFLWTPDENQGKLIEFAIKHKRLQPLKYFLHCNAAQIRKNKTSSHAFTLIKGELSSDFQRSLVVEFIKICFPGKSISEIISGKGMRHEDKIDLVNIFQKIGRNILNGIYEMVSESLTEAAKSEILLDHVNGFFPQYQKEIAKFLIIDCVERSITAYNENKPPMKDGENVEQKIACCQKAIVALNMAIRSGVFTPELRTDASRLRDFISGIRDDGSFLAKEACYIPRGPETNTFIERCRQMAIPSGLAVFEMEQKSAELGISIDEEEVCAKAHAITDSFMDFAREIKGKHSRVPTHFSDDEIDSYEAYREARREAAAKRFGKDKVMKSALQELRSAEISLDKSSAEYLSLHKQREELLRNEIRLTKQFEKLQREIEILRKKSLTPELKQLLREKILSLKAITKSLEEMEATRRSS